MPKQSWGVTASVEGKGVFAGTGGVGPNDLPSADRMECIFIPLTLIPTESGSRVKKDNVRTRSRMVILVELHEITWLKTADELAAYLDLALSQGSSGDHVRRGPLPVQAMRG